MRAHGGERKFKYEIVIEVLMAAPTTSTKDEIAAEVRRRAPWGTFASYRVLEDIGHLLRADGRFVELGSHLTTIERAHLECLRDCLKARQRHKRRD
jgi:hypothetical protein